MNFKAGIIGWLIGLLIAFAITQTATLNFLEGFFVGLVFGGGGFFIGSIRGKIKWN